MCMVIMIVTNERVILHKSAGIDPQDRSLAAGVRDGVDGRLNRRKRAAAVEVDAIDGRRRRFRRRGDAGAGGSRE